MSGTPPQIIDSAAEWFVTMREANVSGEDRQAFADWLRASPVHVAAYLEVAKLWTDAAHVAADLPVELTETLPANVVSMREAHLNRAAAQPPNAALAKRRSSRGLQ